MLTPSKPASAERIRLTVGGVANDTWTGWQVDSDLLTPADGFELELYTRQQVRLPAAVAEGAACELTLGDDKVLTGRVDELEHDVSRRGHTVRIVGRDLAGALVDCSTPFVSLREATLQQIVDEVVKPLGIGKVAIHAPSAKVRRRVQVEPGQTAWNALQQVAMANGLWPWMQPDGTLVVGAPDYAAAPVGDLTLQLDGADNNVTRMSVRRSMAESHSPITVLGQHGQFDGDGYQVDRVGLSAKVQDDALARRGIFRPRVVVASDCDNHAQAAERANKLLADSQLAGFEIRAQVAGWHASGGAVWMPGQRVRVVSEPHGLSATYFVMARTLRLTRRDGAVTQLSLRQDKTWSVGGAA